MKKNKIVQQISAAALTLASIGAINLLIAPYTCQNVPEMILSTEATRYTPIEETVLESEILSLFEHTSKSMEKTSVISESAQKFEIESKASLCELPSISTHIKFFIDYRSYNLSYTPHYRLQQAAWTDENGFRRFNDDYIVALGSFYSTNIGDRFRVTLSSGSSFTVIFGDGNCDSDCDSKCMYMPCTDYNGKSVGNLMEFVIDQETINSAVYGYGSIEIIEGFEGDIVKMEYLGRDMSQDWDNYYE